MKEPRFLYDEETGFTTCILEDKGKYFIGEALCHDEDIEFSSQRTGEQIAASRAYIQYLKYIRDTIKIELKTLKHFYSCIKMHKDFNKNNHAVKLLLRNINRLSQELVIAQSEVIEERNNLKTFLDNKNKLYRQLEQKREKQNNN